MGNAVPKPEALVKALLWWLSARSGRAFTFAGRKLPVGSQRDSVSCGFFAMNAIAHGVYGTDLLAHEAVRGNRLMWFNDICGAVVQQVIHLPFSKSSSMPTVRSIPTSRNIQHIIGLPMMQRSQILPPTMKTLLVTLTFLQRVTLRGLSQVHHCQ